MQTPDGYQRLNRIESGRRLQADGAPLFADRSPLAAGTLRGTLWATLALIVTAAVTILETQTGVLPAWWPVVVSPLLVQVLRLREGYIDQQARR